MLRRMWVPGEGVRRREDPPHTSTDQRERVGQRGAWRTLGLAIVGLLFAAIPVTLLGAAPGQAEEAEAPEAQEKVDYSRPGPYIGLSGVFAVEEFPGSDYDDSMGIGARLGYRTHEIFALELHYEYAANFENDSRGGDDVDTHVATANMKAIAPFGAFQPYLLVGAGFMAVNEGSDEIEDFALRAGGGLDLHVSSDVVFGVDATYVKPSGGADEYDYISVGFAVRYRF